MFIVKSDMCVVILLYVVLFGYQNAEGSTIGGPRTFREAGMHQLVRASHLLGTVGSSMSISVAIASAFPGTVSSLASESLASFYARYPYQKPSDILPFIFDTAREGDTSGVIKAMDIFHNRYPMYNLTPTKAAVLSREVGEVGKLQSVRGRRRLLELGSFFGYSALNIAMSMGEQFELTMVEGSADNAEVARQVLTYGLPTETLKRIRLVRSLSSRALQLPGALLLEPIASTTGAFAHAAWAQSEDFVFRAST